MARRTTLRIRRLRAAGVLAVAAAIAAALGYQLPASSSPTALSPRAASSPHAAARSAVPDGTTAFDDDVPGVARLDRDLLAALRAAATAAADEGIAFVVDSGWRSRAYQARLFREAVAKYGSEAEAARWVATPGTSAHVSGEAVDLGPAGARAWLSLHGAGYGLCQIYANEPWHYELRPDAGERGCPPMYADAASR